MYYEMIQKFKHLLNNLNDEFNVIKENYGVKILNIYSFQSIVETMNEEHLLETMQYKNKIEIIIYNLTNKIYYQGKDNGLLRCRIVFLESINAKLGENVQGK